MNFEINAKGYKPLQLTHEVLAGWEQFHIPGTTPYSCVASFGNFLIQLMEPDGLGCLYMIFSLEETVSFVITIPRSSVTSCVVFKGNFVYEQESHEHFHISENQFNIFLL